jgi:DNA-binding response OmpR family regulator
MPNLQGKILITDDDNDLRQALRCTLQGLGFEITECSNGEQAIKKIQDYNFDIVLLDINMPGMGGIEACSELRRLSPRLEIIMLTVRDNEEDKVNALDAGADDYITKPFSMPELVARLRAALRRIRISAQEKLKTIVIGEIELDPDRRTVRKAYKAVHLTPKEFDLLLQLSAPISAYNKRTKFIFPLLLIGFIFCCQTSRGYAQEKPTASIDQQMVANSSAPSQANLTNTESKSVTPDTNSVTNNVEEDKNGELVIVPLSDVPNQAQSAVEQPSNETEPERRAPPAPLDGVFPGSEYIGPTIGVPDTNPIYPLTKELWNQFPGLKKANIKVYGWLNPGYSLSTSKFSNYPQSYSIVPNKIEMDQAVLRIERQPNTVETDHIDWGFRLSLLYGIDYRFTTAQGYFSSQLLNRNSLYGADPVEMYGMIYFPHVAQGMVLKIGRFISPPDIEAQLSPDNFLFTHSVMFTVDCYTQSGFLADIKLNRQWTMQLGFHAGDDIAPWNKAAHPTGEIFMRWVSKGNNDSIYFGIDSVNGGKFTNNHDDLQQSNFTYTHRFNKEGTILTTTEAYYLFQSHALVGGTVVTGPPRPFFTNVGAGNPIPGNAPAIGFVNYTAIKLSNHDFITLRPLDILDDKKGERTGYATIYQSVTVGLTHRFGELLSVRPEIRYEHAYTGRPYDNGTRKGQVTFGIDAIVRF